MNKNGMRNCGKANLEGDCKTIKVIKKKKKRMEKLFEEEKLCTSPLAKQQLLGSLRAWMLSLKQRWECLGKAGGKVAHPVRYL